MMTTQNLKLIDVGVNMTIALSFLLKVNYTYDEYLENLRTINTRGTAKGNIIHALNELINATTAENISRLKAKVYSIEEENGISHGNYNLVY